MYPCCAVRLVLSRCDLLVAVCLEVVLGVQVAKVIVPLVLLLDVPDAATVLVGMFVKAVGPCKVVLIWAHNQRQCQIYNV